MSRRSILLVIILIAFGATGLVRAQEPKSEAARGLAQSEVVQRRPVPLPWKIAIAVVVTVGAGFVLAFSMRAWRSSNLFDRQYRFPAVADVRFRLGGNKSGGCMAVIEFGPRPH